MRAPYLVDFTPAALCQVARERVWLQDNRSPERADAFEAELRHALELIAQCVDMGDAKPGKPNRRHWLLLRSRFHVFYVVDHGQQEIRVTRVVHETKLTKG